MEEKVEKEATGNGFFGPFRNLELCKAELSNAAREIAPQSCTIVIS